MSTDLFLAFLGFAFVTLFTPGPNNLMLMASGANFGLRRTVPHGLGISIGFGAMVALVGVGLVTLFETLPWLDTVLRAVSVAFLAWLAWRIAHAAAPGTTAGKGRPVSFIEAALFQWVNPKGWAMALSSIAAYAPDRNLASVGLLALVFFTIALGSSAFWAVLGRHARRMLSNPRRLTIFSWTMAAALLATLIPVLFA